MAFHSEIGVVIVSCNGKAHLERLMPSLFAQKHRIMRIIVVDNGSDDGTKEWLSATYPMIHIIAMGQNCGFARPNNHGIDYLLNLPNIRFISCINNDTFLPDDFFDRLASFAERNGPKIGAVQTKIVSFKNPSIIDSTGITIDMSVSAINEGQGEFDHGQFEQAREIFGATASAAIYTREAMEALRQCHGEYFDADYFAYQEDVDLAFRLRHLGYSAWYVPGTPVLHVHSATGKNQSPFKSYHIHRNTLYTLVKNMPGPLVYTGIFCFIKKYGALLGSYRQKRGPSYELSQKIRIWGMISIVFKVWIMLVLHMPILLAKRRRIQKTKSSSINEVKEWMRAYRADPEKMAYGMEPEKLAPLP